MSIEVLDKETVGNDKFMGRCKVSIMEWIANGQFDGDVELEDKATKVVGRISLSAKFERPGSSAITGYEDRSPVKNQLAVFNGNNLGVQPPRDPQGKFTDEEILEAFKAFDLDKNNFIGASEIRHVLINIGEQVRRRRRRLFHLVIYLHCIETCRHSYTQISSIRLYTIASGRTIQYNSILFDSSHVFSFTACR
jgi:EF-hand domain